MYTNTIVKSYKFLFNRLPSGNDASLVLAETIGIFLYFENRNQTGKIKNMHFMDAKRDFPFISNSIVLFINEMNKYTKKLGLLNTLYNNPHGLQNKLNISTV